MVMNGFDTNFDLANEVYAVNSVGFHYVDEPIAVRATSQCGSTSSTSLEYDPLNSFHVHGNFFHYFPTGTSLAPSEFTDTVIQGQGQRGILELRFPYDGDYMFHAHVRRVRRARLVGLLPRRRPLAPVRRGRVVDVLRAALGQGEPGLMEAGRACRTRSRRRPAGLGPGPDPAGADRRRDRHLRPARRARPRRAQRAAGRGNRGRAHGPAPGRDRADPAQRRPRPGRSRPGRGQRRLRALQRPTAAREIGRLGSTTLRISYPWIEGEAYEIFVLTSTGGNDRGLDPGRGRNAAEPTPASSA